MSSGAAPARRLNRTVPPEKDGRRVKSLLKTEFHMAEGYIAALKLRPDGILLNGERVHTDVCARAGDVLSVRVDDPEGGNPAEPIAVPLRICYEDEDLAVIEKPAGMLVHAGEGKGAPTVANALAAYWGQEQAFHPVHRLDRGTSGLLLVAKNRYVSELLRRCLHTEDFVREYLALAEGRLEPAAGQIALPLGPAEGERFRQCVREDGRQALTSYETLGVFPGGSLLRLRLYTGRTHQIRAHLAALGHPLVGDLFYGARTGEALGRPALHAAALRLRHPVTGEMLCLESPLPEELCVLLSADGN
ncbi:MAG: RluA family pseudouridine synthase [Eubacteriales bacterium]|nr:RluA family pseudouridine synthase [Eubacteriales bacterium]